MENNIVAKQFDSISFFDAPQDMLGEMIQLSAVEWETSASLKDVFSGVVVADCFNQILSAKDYSLKIPGEIRQMLADGSASFDKSSKVSGGFTPNIRINGEKGIKCQAVVENKIQLKQVSSAISKMAILIFLNTQVERLEKKTDALIDSVKWNGISLVTENFDDFRVKYPTYMSKEEIFHKADYCSNRMKEGLGQLFHQICNEYNDLLSAPGNWIEALKLVFSWSISRTNEYKVQYRKFLSDLILFKRLLFMTDLVLLFMGPDAVVRNHERFDPFFQNALSLSFQHRMGYLMGVIRKICKL